MTSESDIRERETASANPGQAANGRFQLGNPGGPGNPLGGRIAAARRVLMDRITDEELTAIWDRVITMAKDGHWQSIKLVLSYVIGKPGKMPTFEDLGDIESPSPNGVFSAPPADTPPPESPPSPNGVFCEIRTALNGSIDAAPKIPVAAPSPNGVFSTPTPRNRKERRAQRKAQRIAQRKADRAPAGSSA